jgi:hypothetical protein
MNGGIVAEKGLRVKYYGFTKGRAYLALIVIGGIYVPVTKTA